MNLRVFKEKFPMFRPHIIVIRKETNELLELISYPYFIGAGNFDLKITEDNPLLIRAREPGEPTTSQEYTISPEKSELYPVMAVCQRDMSIFIPTVTHNPLAEYPCMINCIKCGRGYFYEKERSGFYADRLLGFKRYKEVK